MKYAYLNISVASSDFGDRGNANRATQDRTAGAYEKSARTRIRLHFHFRRPAIIKERSPTRTWLSPTRRSALLCTRVVNFPEVRNRTQREGPVGLPGGRCTHDTPVTSVIMHERRGNRILEYAKRRRATDAPGKVKREVVFNPFAEYFTSASRMPAQEPHRDALSV